MNLIGHTLEVDAMQVVWWSVIPAFAVGIGLITAFAFYISRRDKREMHQESEWKNTIRLLTTENHQFQQQMGERVTAAFQSVVATMNKANEILVRNTEALHRVEEYLEQRP